MIFVGIDVGSSAVKTAALVVDDRGARVLSTSLGRLRRRGVREVAAETLSALLRQCAMDRAAVTYVGATGHAEAAGDHDGRFSSLTCHALGAAHLAPGVRTVVDLGALEIRCARIDPLGRVQAHRITGQCASGAGQFIENLSRHLGVQLDQVGQMSLSAKRSETVSSVCAVLAETDVVNMVARGVPVPEILRGIHDATSERVIKLVSSVRGEAPIGLTGGLSRDDGLTASLSGRLRGAGIALGLVPIAEAMFAGAIGAALCGANRASTR